MSEVNLNAEKEFVDLRFTDLLGRWHHISHIIHSHMHPEEEYNFDGSSLKGWKSVDNSDMILTIDQNARSFHDPFTAYSTTVSICNVLDPVTGSRYNKDPRYISFLAQEYLRSEAIADVAYFGPELEFFIFDDVKYHSGDYRASYAIDSEELPSNSDKEYELNNLAHRPSPKGGYMPTAPADSNIDIRQEISNVLSSIGIKVMLHHHEVAPAQQELGIHYSDIIESADNSQKYKYIVHNIAKSYGKTATFMPKPLYNDNGSGMHTHQSLALSDGTNIFKGSHNGIPLSEVCLYYIGGIMKHIKALNAFCNPSTNSYKRLVPGFEAPVANAYSLRNRSVGIRIPHVSNPNATRIEARFPDGTANPYLSFAAMLMAGIDGIKNQIDPGEPNDKNLFIPENLAECTRVSSSLEESLEALDNDRDFLKAGGVFSDDLIDSYIKIKMAEHEDIIYRPHPLEFQYYYSC